MKVQMIAAEIREDSDLESQAHNTLHLDRMRRNLHDRVMPSGIGDLPEQLFKIRCLRRRALGRVIEPRTPIFDRTEYRRRMSGRFQYRLDHVGGRRLPVCAGYTHQVQPSGRMTVKIRGHPGQYGTLVIHLNPRHRKGCDGRLRRDHSGGSLHDSLRHVAVSIRTRSPNGKEEVAGRHFP